MALVTLLLGFVCSGLVMSQEKLDELEVRALVNEQRRAVVQYRAGDVDAARTILESRTPAVNRLVAQRIIKWLADQQPQLQDARRQLVEPWSPRFVATLASLQMELALRTYAARRTVDEYRFHVETARLLFEAATRHGEPSLQLLPRWNLAIGGAAHADGQLWWAAAILDDACRRHQRDVDLLVACGSVHETIALLPAHVLLAGGRIGGDEPWAQHLQSRLDARAAQGHHIAAARRTLDAALAIDPTHVEARLRRGHLWYLSGNGGRGAPLLEATLREQRATELRSAFLTRLLLGRIRVALDAPEEAVKLFEQCIELVPSAQSGYVALAHALHRSGRALDAARITERMFTAPAQPLDPWSSYAYGQYWVPEPLLASLRKEAQK